MARRLGLTDVHALVPDPDGNGSGAVGSLPRPMTARAFVDLAKKRFGAAVARCSHTDPDRLVGRVALCGGAGGSFIDNAVDAGADVYLTGDIRYHDFQERADDIFLVDIGHFETEQCSSSIFFHIIKEKFPTFAVQYSNQPQNPVEYL